MIKRVFYTKTGFFNVFLLFFNLFLCKSLHKRKRVVYLNCQQIRTTTKQQQNECSRNEQNNK